MKQFKEFDLSRQIKNILKFKNVPNNIKACYRDSMSFKKFYSSIANSSDLSEKLNQYREIDATRISHVKEFESKLRENRERHHLRRIYKRFYLYTASLAALLLVGFLIVQSFHLNKTPLLTNVSSSFSVPTLIMNDGNRYNVKDVVNVNDINKITTLVELNRPSRSNQPPILNSSIQNQLIVPSGYTQELWLCDSTRVQLNSMSSIEFPSEFTDSVRRVRIEGEVYFCVTKNEKPFIVEYNNLEIRVLGTKFNVNTLSDSSCEVLLLEGRVKVKASDGSIELAPNQLLTYDSKEGTMTIQTVSSYNYSWWLDDNFELQEGKLSRLIYSIEKWYGVEIENAMTHDIIVTVSLSKQISLEQMLESIQLLYDVRIIQEGGGYRIENRIKI